MNHELGQFLAIYTVVWFAFGMFQLAAIRVWKFLSFASIVIPLPFAIAVAYLIK